MARESPIDMTLWNKSLKEVRKPAWDDEKGFLGRGNSRCKVPEMRACLASSISSKEARVAGAEGRGKEGQEESQG